MLALRSFRLRRTAIHPCVKNFSTSRAVMAAISDAITKDHRELEEYASKILSAKDDDTKTRWQNQFVWELARHAISEELVVYPAFEKYLGIDGKKMADKDRAEHQSIKDALFEFQNLKADTEDFIPTLMGLMRNLDRHMKEEEVEDLPALEDAILPGESESLAKSFSRTKAFVPSRSHPSVPNKPPFETVVGLMMAPIDRLRDMLRKFPDDTDCTDPSTKVPR